VQNLSRLLRVGDRAGLADGPLRLRSQRIRATIRMRETHTCERGSRLAPAPLRTRHASLPCCTWRVGYKATRHLCYRARATPAHALHATPALHQLHRCTHHLHPCAFRFCRALRQTYLLYVGSCSGLSGFTSRAVASSGAPWRGAIISDGVTVLLHYRACDGHLALGAARQTATDIHCAPGFAVRLTVHPAGSRVSPRLCLARI